MLQEICEFSLFLFSGATVQQVKNQYQDENDLTGKLQDMLAKESLIDTLSAEVQRLRRMHSARQSQAFSA